MSTTLNANSAKVMVLAGAGEGLGAALAARFIAGGYRVVGLSRSAHPLPLEGYVPLACDLTQAHDVEAAFQRIDRDFGAPSVVIHTVGDLLRSPFLEISAVGFQRVWLSMVLSAMLVSHESISRMVARGSGALLFSGATASLRGGANFSAFASAKFAVRGLAQSLAREFQPQGVHVAHVVLDGLIDEAPQVAASPNLDPAALADAYWDLAHQPTQAWTHELDLRPMSERF